MKRVQLVGLLCLAMVAAFSWRPAAARPVFLELPGRETRGVVSNGIPAQFLYPEIAQLAASDAGVPDEFGQAVALNGDTLVVGAPYESGGPGDPLEAAGAVYVFERDLGGTDNWGQAARLAAVDAQSGDWFGWSVAISGDTVVVGAPTFPYSERPGSAYVFERDLGGQDSWGWAVKLTASDAQLDDAFGEAVAIDGDTIVAGALWEDGGSGDPLENTGATYVFERDLGGAGQWGEAAKLVAGDAQAGDHFGWAVGIGGDTLVVGARHAAAGPGEPLADTGAVYIFERDLGGPGSWGQAAKISAGDPQVEDYFGWVVRISGDTLAVGAPYEDGGPGDPLTSAGAVYIFQRNLGGPGSWGQAARLTAGDAQAGDQFGRSIGLSGDRLIVGAWLKDGDDPLFAAGAAYVFELGLGGPGLWGQAAKLTASDAQLEDFFGSAAAVDGDTIAVGAVGEDGGPDDPLPDSGAVYVFQAAERIYLPVVRRD